MKLIMVPMDHTYCGTSHSGLYIQEHFVMHETEIGGGLIVSACG